MTSNKINLQAAPKLLCLTILLLGVIVYSPILSNAAPKARNTKESGKRDTSAKASGRTEKRTSITTSLSADRHRAQSEDRARHNSRGTKDAPRNASRTVSKDSSKSASRSAARNVAKDTGKRVPKVASSARDPKRDSPSGSTAQAKNNSSFQKRAARLAEMQRAEKLRTEPAQKADRSADRLAAHQDEIARQREQDETLRDQVQSMIARDDTTGEDLEVRRVAVNALGNHAGTVVVMDPKTGRVFSIVNQEWALHEGFKPCSTIKLVTGLAGLNERVIDPADGFATADVSDRGQVNLTKALAYSKNEYFQQVGGQVGFDKMISYARRLGLGEKTGINVPNEFQGRIPTLKSGFALNRMSSHGDDFKVTAVQLATLVSAMGNGGKLLTPHIARTQQDEARFKPKVRRMVNIDRDIWQYMVPGMVGSVSYGSGYRAHDPAQTVVGKTGTCIEPGGTWVGLFTSYAPLANPRLAVVVIARGADAQSHFPAAVAGRIYRDLDDRFNTPGNLQVATKFDSQNNSRSDSSRKTYVANNRLETEIAVHGDDDDEAAVKTTAALARPSWRPSVNSTPNNTVKPVLMQVPKRATKPTPKPSPELANDTEERATASVAVLMSGSDGQTRPRRVFSAER